MTITILFILGIIIFLIFANLIMLLAMSFTFQQEAIKSLYSQQPRPKGRGLQKPS